MRDLAIPSASGEILARLYRGSGNPRRLLVYFHGGGWVLGSLDSADSACRFLAGNSGVSVLSVDYRLAPEHPFPAALEDATTACMFAAARAGQWGHDPTRIAVGGDSAGGNLAAVLSQELRGAAVRPAFQLLFFPVTDLSAKSESYREFAEGCFLTEKQMDWYRDHYLGEADPAAPPSRPCWPPTSPTCRRPTSRWLAPTR